MIGTRKVRKAGASLIVTIPSRFVKRFGIRVGTHANISYDYSDPSVKVSFERTK